MEQRRNFELGCSTLPPAFENLLRLPGTTVVFGAIGTVVRVDLQAERAGCSLDFFQHRGIDIVGGGNQYGATDPQRDNAKVNGKRSNHHPLDTCGRPGSRREDLRRSIVVRETILVPMPEDREFPVLNRRSQRGTVN
jgi:hypothetical protein